MTRTIRLVCTAFVLGVVARFPPRTDLIIGFLAIGFLHHLTQP